jgi:hypothetical protein
LWLSQPHWAKQAFLNAGLAVMAADMVVQGEALMAFPVVFTEAVPAEQIARAVAAI